MVFIGGWRWWILKEELFGLNLVEGGKKGG